MSASARVESDGSRVIAWLLDDLVRISGTDIGLGLASGIGLVPVLDSTMSLFAPTA